MAIDIQTYTNFIKSNVARTHLAKIQFLDWNENIVSEITEDIISADMTLTNQFGQRRNATITLQNVNGQYLPKYRNKIWLNTKIRLMSGYLITGTDDDYIDRGIFVISEVQAISNGAEKTIVITALDKFALLDNSIAGTLKDEYIIPVNTSIDDAVKNILVEATEIKNPIIMPTGISTYYTITKVAGATYADMLKDLANMVSYDCFFDKHGYLRFQPPPVDTITGDSNQISVWDFDIEDINYMGVNHRYKFDSIHNFITVIGENIKGAQVQAVAQDNNPFSSTRIPLITERVLVINDSNIYSVDLCQTRANWELYKSITLQESIDITCIPIDIIEENSIITILDSSAGTNRERYIVNTINFSFLSENPITINAWKLRYFGA